MLTAFTGFIKEQILFTEEDNLLVGVSGGKDSVVLIDLLNKSGVAFSIAHCNFHLRGEESDADENLVENLAKKYDTNYYKADFDTDGYAKENGVSIEMAARELRYNWFEKIRKKEHYDYIAVAHHSDDSIETFFLNIARGTGLKGLTGIKPKNNYVVRPLLFATQKEIDEYCRKNRLEYRDDSSNKSLDFMRNKIRHQVLPLMEEINPSFRATMGKNINYLNDISTIFYQDISQTWERVAVRKDNEWHISISELKTLNPLSAFLFEFLKPFHFKGDIINDILNTLDSISGKQFFSHTHRIIRDRDSLIITPLPKNEQISYYLEEGESTINQPVQLQIETIERDSKFKISRSSATAYIDYDKIKFPLKLRRWKKGEYFKPLGMDGFKKLSDFFIDNKMSIPEKENTWIIANGDQVVWIVGKRLDDRYKITDSTKKILKITLL
jgi:tRNA(Ile)-lysidine synthase